MDLETAIEAEKKARKALSAIRDEQDRRLHEARRAIHAEFGDAISAASKALNEASANVRKVKDTAPDHPWTGKRVRREKPVGYHWENRTETVSGIVETYRSTTHRPANLGSWRLPEIGSPIVRFLKKDGSPGVLFEPMREHDGWKLCEKQQ